MSENNLITAFVGGVLLAQTGSGFYVEPYAWKSLSQWWGLFRRVRLLMYTNHYETPPQGWVRVPDSIECCEIFNADRPTNFLRRRKIIAKNARTLLDGVGLLYARMPFYESYYTFQVAAKLGISTFTEFHGDWHACALAETDAPFVRRVTRKHRAFMARRLYDDMAARSEAVVTIGPVMAEKYVPKGKPVLVSTNNAIDLCDYAPRTDFTLKKPPRILYVGRIELRKGLQYLFEALRLLKACGQDFQFIAIGDDMGHGTFQRLAEQGGFADRVRFVEKLPLGPPLMDEYRNADLFVLPSLAEGVSRVVHEAMTVGCPVVATDVGSTSWQLRDGAGIVVPPYDSQALKEAIRRVLNDQQLRQTLSDRGLCLATQYTFERQRAAIADFIHSHIPTKFLNPP